MNKQDILVSVILPLYNAEKFIKLAVDSVLNQTYKNFELIIINDGSTDNSYKIVSEISDSRILLINQENLGLAATLNKCLKLAKGDLIARMDADDICEPNRLELQVKCFQKNPNLVLLGGSTKYIDENGKLIAQSFPIVGSNNIKYFLLNKGNVIAHPTVMFKKEAVLKAGGYCEKIGQYFEDHDLWVSMFKLGDFENLETPILQYRLTPGSISGIRLENDDFNTKVLAFLNKKHNGKTQDFNLISERKINLAKITQEEKIRLFNNGILSLKNSENKMKLILNSIPFLSLKNKLKLLSTIRTKI